MPQTTDNPSSLESIAARIEAKASAPLAEQPNAATTQPEPTPTTAPESQQAPAAPTDEVESEQATPSDAEQSDDAETPPPQKFTVKVDGTDHEVTLDDLLKGYSFTEHNTRKSQAIAEEKRQFEAERQRFQTEEAATLRAKRAQYDTYLTQLSDTLQALTPKEPDWETHRQRVTPDVFAADVLTWNQNQKHLERVEAEKSRVKAERDAEAQQGFQQYVNAERAKLEAAIPEFKDPEKSKALKSELQTFGTSHYGFTEEEFGQVTDSRMVRLLRDAHLYHASKAKAPAIENKIERVLDTSRPGSRTTAPQKNELAAAHARLRESGKVDDAAEAIRLKFARQKR